MDGRKIALLVGALVVAAFAAFMARSMMGGAPAPQATANAVPVEPQGPQVLVATRALPVGTIIDPNAFRAQPWPKDLVEDNYFLKGSVDPQTLAGRVVRYAITAGQPLTQGALVKPGDRGFLAAALQPGMRAITVPVNAQSGVAGFIFPGDRVDLVLTHSVKGGGDGDPLNVSETVLRNVRVLATDQRTTPSGEDGKAEVQPFSNVTLEVTPRIAEKIAVAQTIGDLSLSLRSIADNAAQIDEAIAEGDIDLSDAKNPKAEQRMLAAIAARPIDQGTTYTTGADVSRYERSTVPGKPDTAGAPMAGVPQAPGSAPAAQITGPAVRVARGNEVTVVPVGGK